MIFLAFTGQGSQTIGMGKDFHEEFAVCRNVMDEIETELGFNLREVMFPEGENAKALLARTKMTQPAIFAFETMVFALLESMFEDGLIKKIIHCAGHSIGEYASLVASKTISLGLGAGLVKKRAELMSDSCQKLGGAMAALIDFSAEEVMRLTEEVRAEGICDIANYNSNNQIIISGSVEAIDKALKCYKDFGKGRAIKLAVEGAFHSHLMREAAQNMEAHLKTQSLSILSPRFSVLSNVDAYPMPADESEIKARLCAQIQSPVQWRDIVAKALACGTEIMIEIGPANVLARMAMKDYPELLAISINKTKDVDRLKDMLL